VTSHLFVIGINYRQVPLSERAKAATAKEAHAAMLGAIKSLPAIDEVAFLSTCNRVEHYGYGQGKVLLQWLDERYPDLRGHWFFYKDHAAARHLFRVASGLDSAILGEPQITGQVKKSYFEAKEANALGTVLHRLFEYAFHAAKRVRHETAVGMQPISFASIAVNLVHRVYDLAQRPHVVILGAGEMARLALLHFQAHGALLTIASRNLERAQTLAKTLAQMPNLFQHYQSSLPEQMLLLHQPPQSSPSSRLPCLQKAGVIVPCTPWFLLIWRFRGILILALAA